MTKVRGCGGASEGAVVRGCAKHTVEPSILAARHLPAIVLADSMARAVVAAEEP